jgi:LPXTG-motif cell wall-anchored protein
MKKKILSLLLSAAVLFSSFPINAALAAENQEVLNPGSVGDLDKDGARIEKSAEHVPGSPDEYIVTLKVEGKDIVVNNAADVVLVIDRSGSMSGSIGDMKEAAKDFVDQLLTENSGNRVAVVSFGGNVTVNSQLTGYQKAEYFWQEDNQALKDQIDALYANGGTYTQGGIHAANEILANSGSKNRIVVLLTDGNPTYSATPQFDNLTISCEKNGNKSSCKNTTYSGSSEITGWNYNSTLGNGSGSSATATWTCNRGKSHNVHVMENGTDTKKNLTIDHKDSAIYEADLGKSEGYTYYTIGYGEATTDNSFKTFLENVASKNDQNQPLYYSGSSTDIDKVFENIGNSIKDSIQGGAVTDPMGDMVDLVYTGELPQETTNQNLPNGGFYVSQGTVTYDPETATFSWNPGSIKSGTAAVLRYRVKLDVERSGFQADQLYSTNGTTTFSYTKPDGSAGELEFLVPQVMGDYGQLYVRGYLVNKNGDPIDANGNVVSSIAQAAVVYDTTDVINEKNSANQWAFGSHTVEALTQAGYTLYGGEYTQQLTISSTTKAATAWFPYTQNEDTFTVHHFYEQTDGSFKEDTAKITTGTIRFGETKEAAGYVSNVDGYTYDPSVEGSVTSIIYDADPLQQKELKLYYTRNPYTLTIEYVYEGGEKAHDSYTATLKTNDPYSVESPVIEGYTADKAIVSGTMPAGNHKVVVTYTANEYDLIIHYVYEGGGEAAPDYTGTFDYKTPYSVPSPGIPGYTADQQVVSGSMPAKDVEVTVTYTANDYKLTILYQYKDGSEAMSKYEKEKLHIGDNYSVESPAITGYTPDIAVVKGAMPAENVTVVVTYIPNTYQVTVHYQYEDGTEAKPDVTEEHRFKENYNIQSPAIEGYTPNKPNVAGTMPAENVEETVVYTKNSYKLTIEYVYDEDGSQAAETVERVVKYGDPYEVGSPVIEGYTASVLTVKGTMPASDVKEVVRYKANEYNLTINYVYKGGEKDGETAAPSVQQKVAYGKGYNVASPAVENYAPDRQSVTGIMPAQDVVETVYYTGNPYQLIIHYVYEDGAEAKPTVQQSVAFGSAYSVASPEIYGYTPDLSVVEGVMPAQDVETTVTYKANPHKLTIEYIYHSSGEEAAPAHESTVAYGTKYSVDSPAVEGYTPNLTVVSGTMPDEDVKVVVEYYIDNYNLTIEYVFEDGSPAADSYFDTLDYNTPYEVESPVLEGYTANRPVVSGVMPAGNKTETVVYTANEYKLTINYKFMDGTTAAASFSTTLKYGTEYSQPSPDIKGYKPTRQVVSGEMPAHDVEVDVIYMGNPYTLTVKYVYEDGTTAAPDYTKTVNCGDPYEQASPVIPGYTPDKAAVSGVMPAEDLTLTVKYTGNPYKLTINYVYEDQSTAAESYEATVRCGDTFERTSPLITGFTADQAVVSGTMPAEDLTVTVVYRANPYHLTIHYQYADGTTAAPDYNQVVKFGQDYQQLSPVLNGYTADKLIVAGTMPAEDVEVYVTYTANDYSLTVRYVYANGGEAAPTVNKNVAFGKDYSVTSPAISGYTVDRQVVSGTMPAHDVIETVIYTPIDYTLTIKYQYEDGSEAAEDVVRTLHVNDPYSVASPVITGFTPDYAVIAGTMPASNVKAVVTYVRNSYNLAVNYVFEDGTTAAPTYTDTLDYEDPYSVDSPKVEGYTPDRDPVEGTMPADNVQETVTYKINSYQLTINYIYEDGSKAAESHTETLDYKAGYSVQSPEIEGYTADKAVVLGTMPAGDVVVTVKYTANPYTLTVRYQYANGQQAAGTVTQTLNINNEYSVASPAIEGYTADKPVVAGTMPARDVDVLVVYNANPYTLTVKYQYTDGSEAAPTETQTVFFGSSYNVVSPTIEGYTADKPVVAGTMPAKDVEVVVVYNTNSYKLTVEYVYTDGTTAKPTVEQTLAFHADYSVESPAIEGYTPDKPVVAGTMPAKDVYVKVVYNANPYTLTVKYQYADGREAAPAATQTVLFGGSYSVQSPEITGYTPDLRLVTGVMPAHDVEVIVTYVANDYNLTVNYVYEDGTPAAPSYMENVAFGKDYRVLSPAVEGYTPDQTVVTGTMPAGNVVKTVVYRANDYKLTVHYQYEDGSEAAPDVQQTLKFQSGYSVASPVLEGYTADIGVVAGTMPAHDVEVTVTYRANPYRLIINYVYEGGSVAAPQYNAVKSFKEGYEVASPAIEGYTPDVTVAKGTMPAKDLELTVTYRANSYNLTVEYVYENGDKAAETHTSTVVYGKRYSVVSPKIEGYTPDVAVVTGVMPAHDVTAKVVYKANDYKLNIRYVYENGTQAAPTVDQILHVNDEYSVESPAITGYTPDIALVSGKMPARDVFVVVTYRTNDYNLTVKYVYEDGTTAAPTHNDTLAYGSDYSVVSPAVEGYTPDKAIVFGTMPADSVEEVVTYKANDYTLTIDYQYANGTTAAQTVQRTLHVRDDYSIASPAILGYTPDLGVVAGTMPAGNVHVVVTYTANDYNLTIRYQYEDGGEAAKTYTDTLHIRDPYNVPSPGITGYTPDIAVVKGSMPAQDVELVVTYSINDYNLEITYVYEDGSIAADAHSERLSYKSDYSVESPAIEGYTPDLAVVAGTMPAADVAVRVTYTANSYNLTVKYQYEDGTEAANPVNSTVKFGDSYNVPSPAIEGYTPDLALVAGVMPAKDVEVLVTYRTNSYNLTVNYQFEDGSPAANTYFESLPYGSDYDVQSPTVEGYTPDLAAVTGTMPAGDVEKTVIYKANPYQLTVKYQYADGTEAAPDYTQTLLYGADYSVQSPAVEGHTPNLAVVAGKMPAKDVEVIVVYTANDYNLTVYYVYEDGSAAAPTHFDTLSYGADYSVASPAIAGYTPDTALVAGKMPADAVEVTVTYKANDYSLTVNYVYEDGSEAAPQAQQTLHVGDTYNVESPAITGYTPDIKLVAGKMPADNVSVTVTYKANNYNLLVEYQFEDGTPAAPQYSGTVAFGEGYSVDSPVVEGYTPDLTVVSGTMPAEDVHVVVTYKAIDYKLTVNYVYEDGSEAAPQAQQTLHVRDIYNVASPAIEGFTPDIQTVAGVMPADDVEVTVTYKANDYRLTVNYQYADGSIAAAQHNETVKFGDRYNVASPAIEGFTPDQAVVAGTMPAGDLTVTVTYTANEYNLTVSYQFADGTEAAPAVNKTLKFRDNYSVKSPDVEGYTPDLAVVAGSMPAKDVQVVVTYVANNYNLTVNYVYEDGTPAAPSHFATLDFGSDYSVDSPAIEGYTPDQAVVAGRMPASAVEVTVTYTANDYNLTVKYQYADGSEAAPTAVKTLHIGDTYSIASPSITGYTADLSLVAGTMPAKDVEVIVTYVANDYNLTVNYVYEDGTPAANSHFATLEFGGSYNVPSPAITGYTPDLAVVSGTMPAEEVVVTVTYRANDYRLHIIYVYEDGSEAAPPFDDTRKFGEAYSIASPVVAGYTADIVTVTGRMPAEDVSVVVTYRANDYRLTINYVYEDGAPAAPAYGADVPFNGGYEVPSPGVEGYTPDQTVVSGTMPNRDLEITVTYTANLYGYTVEYYYADELDATKTENLTAAFGSVINTYTDKPELGFEFDRVEGLGLVISADEASNVIRVYYMDAGEDIPDPDVPLGPPEDPTPPVNPPAPPPDNEEIIPDEEVPLGPPTTGDNGAVLPAMLAALMSLGGFLAFFRKKNKPEEE